MPMARIRAMKAEGIRTRHEFMSLCISNLLRRRLCDRPRSNYCLTLSQAVAGRNHMDFSRLLGSRTHNQQGHAAKCSSMVGTKRFYGCGISVVHGCDLASAGHVEMYEIVSGGTQIPILVFYAHGHEREVVAVCLYQIAIGSENNFHRNASSVDLFRSYLLAVVVSNCPQSAGLIRHLPEQAVFGV